MKKTVIKCDYCEEIIKESNTDAIIDGKGYIYIVLEDDSLRLFPGDSGYKAMLSVKLRTISDKHIERDICYKCLRKILKNVKGQNHGNV